MIALGSPVDCTDGPFGRLCDVVVDPIDRRLTQLVVGPRRRHALGRLVPVELARMQDGPTISLALTGDEIRRFEPVDRSAFLRLEEPLPLDVGLGAGIQSVLALPYYVGRGLEPLPAGAPLPVTDHRVPRDEVEIRRASAVVSSDDQRLGRVDGFVVGRGGEITHLALEHGHIFGRGEVTIPIRAVASVRTDSVSLELTREQVAALPAVPLRRWHSQLPLPESRRSA